MKRDVAKVSTSIWATALLCCLAVFQLLLIRKDNIEKINVRTLSIGYDNLLRKFPDQIVFPEYFTELYTGRKISTQDHAIKRVKILSILSVTCVQCMNDLPKWNEYYEQINNSISESSQEYVDFDFVVSGYTKEYVSYMISRHPEFNFPVLYDSSNALVVENGIPDIPATLLLDHDDRVVLVGSPVLRADIGRQYSDSISVIRKRRAPK
jgi:hypothetical protein